MTTEYTKQAIKQNRGPVLKFEGKLLCEGDSGPVKMQVWETAGGALVAVSREEGDRFNDVRATVVEPGDMADALTKPALQREQQAMRFAVMDHFDWNFRAQNMVRKIGWKLVQEVA